MDGGDDDGHRLDSEGPYDLCYVDSKPRPSALGIPYVRVEK